MPYPATTFFKSFPPTPDNTLNPGKLCRNSSLSRFTSLHLSPVLLRYHLPKGHRCSLSVAFKCWTRYLNSQFGRCHFLINSLPSSISLGMTNKVCQPSVSSFPGLFSSLLSSSFIHHTPLMLLLLFFLLSCPANLPTQGKCPPLPPPRLSTFYMQILQILWRND